MTVLFTRYMRDIAVEVAERNEVTVNDLKGPARTRRYSRPRFEAMYFMRQAGHSTTAIGQYLGGRDHATVINGCRRYAAWLEEGAS